MLNIWTITKNYVKLCDGSINKVHYVNSTRQTDGRMAVLEEETREWNYYHNGLVYKCGSFSYIKLFERKVFPSFLNITCYVHVSILQNFVSLYEVSTDIK